MKEIKGLEKVFFGTRKSDNEKIYITKPSWDCKWYWSFGYLGNRDEHYHLSSYRNKIHYLELKDGSHKLITEKRNKNMYDCLIEDYDLNSSIKMHLWDFCELASTCYSLKKTAELLGRGGSHFTTNTCKDIIINKEEVDRINNEVLPELFNALNDIYTYKIDRADLYTRFLNHYLENEKEKFDLGLALALASSVRLGVFKSFEYDFLKEDLKEQYDKDNLPVYGVVCRFPRDNREIRIKWLRDKIKQFKS